MDEKSCLVVFSKEKKGIDVTFVGSWIRADVDRAHFAMFKELPKYIVSIRKKLEEKEKENE